MAVFTSLRILLNFEGVINKMGKYPFAKILIDVVYMSQVWKLGYGIQITLHVWLIGEIGWGCWQMHRQVSVTLLHMC